MQTNQIPQTADPISYIGKYTVLTLACIYKTTDYAFL